MSESSRVVCFFARLAQSKCLRSFARYAACQRPRDTIRRCYCFPCRTTAMSCQRRLSERWPASGVFTYTHGTVCHTAASKSLSAGFFESHPPPRCPLVRSSLMPLLIRLISCRWSVCLWRRGWQLVRAVSVYIQRRRNPTRLEKSSSGACRGVLLARTSDLPRREPPGNVRVADRPDQNRVEDVRGTATTSTAGWWRGDGYTSGRRFVPRVLEASIYIYIYIVRSWHAFCADVVDSSAADASVVTHSSTGSWPDDDVVEPVWYMHCSPSMSVNSKQLGANLNAFRRDDHDVRWNARAIYYRYDL